MNFQKLQELLKMLEYNSNKFTVDMIETDTNKVKVFFNGDNQSACDFFNPLWDWKCEMTGFTSFVVFNLN